MMIINVQDNMFYCPFCGNKYYIEESEKIDYCQHAQYAYVWGADPDFFSYISPIFGKRYIQQLQKDKRYTQYLEEEEIEIGIDVLNSFATGRFEPGDETSKIVPYFEEIAKTICSENTILFKFGSSYSGIVIAINGEKTNL